MQENGEIIDPKLSDINDDNFQLETPKQPGFVTEYTLRKWDFWLYIIGMLVRI